MKKLSKRRNFYFCAMLVALVFCGRGYSSQYQWDNDPEGVKVFILAGQSNMVGHGKSEWGRNPDYDPADPESDEYIIGGLKTTIPFHKQIINHPNFQAGEWETKFISRAPELLQYMDSETESLRLSRLVAEISARGHNPFVGLGEYRGREDKRLGAFEPVLPPINAAAEAAVYPRMDRKGLIDCVRDSGRVHFCDTSTRDITQSNSGNRFRMAEDVIVGPYLDRCGFFSLENGGGAHFHVAMLANMTYPFNEARKWNQFAPRTPKQILIRSTNLLGYKPQPKNLMQLTGEMICEDYDVIRCFDFLNHIENMRPFAEVAMACISRLFSWPFASRRRPAIQTSLTCSRPAA